MNAEPGGHEEAAAGASVAAGTVGCTAGERDAASPWTPVSTATTLGIHKEDDGVETQIRRLMCRLDAFLPVPQCVMIKARHLRF